ncbi:MAG: rod shape-determining protein MreD [Tannerella sp.]|jgi:rod shape-determining protein MreD|nr:rod shape-determining protein MreD [Tannerella sp.]
MIKSIFGIVVKFLIYITLQVLLLNNLHLFGVATLFLYVYVIIRIPINFTRSQVIVIAFLLGLIIDMFTNTLGMHAAACALAGFFREPLLKAYTEREMLEEGVPSSRRLGWSAYIKLTLSVVILHHVTLFLIESLSLSDPLFLMLRIVASVILTSICIFIIELFNILKKSETA